MTKQEIDEILELHKKFLNGEKDGKRADLCGADLCDADLDYSSFPLWCGGLGVHLDDRQIIQLLYHIVKNAIYSKNTSYKVKNILRQKELLSLANEFHRAGECGTIEV